MMTLPGALSQLDFPWGGFKQGLWRYAVAVGMVAVTGLAGGILQSNFAPAGPSIELLAAVILTAVLFGTQPAIAAALVAFIMFNYYLEEPRFVLDFSIDDSVALLVFAGVATVTGELTSRVRRECERAGDRANMADTLFHASRDLSAKWDEREIYQSLVRHIAAAAKGQAFIWTEGYCWSYPLEMAPTDAQLREIGLIGSEDGPPDGVAIGSQQWRLGLGWQARHLRTGMPELGVMVWRSSHVDQSSTDDDRLISVLVELGGDSVMRARLGAANAEMEALARAETFRQSLLSSISHDFRTPLATILASATALRDMGDALSHDARDDLLQAIDEEARRLNQFISNLLQMTRLEGGALNIVPFPVDVAEVVDHVVRRFTTSLDGRKIDRRTDGADFIVRTDPILLDHALGNILENAVRFSPGSSTIIVNLARSDGHTVIYVEDRGPGVAGDEMSKIFEKFYQSPANFSRAQGTGLGLSISKGLIEALGGSIVATRGRGGVGLRVAITL